MKCAIITPIGPGHNKLYEKCKNSIIEAINHSKGSFEDIILIPVDDQEGKFGRSAARNRAIKDASNRGIDWLFFLDADDLILPYAFKAVSPYLNNYDAVWGNIAEIEKGKEESSLRIPQILTINNIKELLIFDPFYTIQMGHFAKTTVALQNLFDESMDCGEDFKYYLKVWEQYNCCKIPTPFFVNRRGFHSQGIRSATGQQWRISVEKLLALYQKKLAIKIDSAEVKEITQKKSLEYSNYSKQPKIAENNMFQKLVKIYD